MSDDLSVLDDRPYPASWRMLGSTPIQRCSLCTKPATVHLPPELGASSLCRAYADRVRAALTQTAQDEEAVLHNINCRASRAPRCTCQECSRG